jgi:hypothetical protein
VPIGQCRGRRDERCHGDGRGRNCELTHGVPLLIYVFYNHRKNRIYDFYILRKRIYIAMATEAGCWRHGRAKDIAETVT